MSNVVFPAPDAPISATSSPDFTYPLAARRSFERHDNVETIDKITVLDDGLDIPGGLLGPAAALLEASAAAVPEREHSHGRNINNPTLGNIESPKPVPSNSLLRLVTSYY